MVDEYQINEDAYYRDDIYSGTDYDKSDTDSVE